MAREINLIETGIDRIDQLLGGGIPKGKSIVYYAQPGIESDIFGINTIYNTLKRGGHGVFIVTSTTPKNITDKFRDFGWPVDSFSNNCIFADAYSPLIGEHSSEKFVISDPENIKNFSSTILDLLENSPPSTIVFDSLSTIMDLCGETETIEAVKIWNETARLHDHVLIYNFTAWAYSKETLKLIKTELFNAVVTICGVGEYILFGKYFGILKLDWKKEPEKNESYASRSIINNFKRFASPWLQYEIDGANVNILREKNTIAITSWL